MRRPIDRQAVGSLAEQLRDATPQELLTWVAEKCSGKVAFASAMGLEDQVLVHMIAESGLDIPVFTLDTGRLSSETYDLISMTEKQYGIAIEIYMPDHRNVERMVREKGPNLFYESVENRRECCRVRKLEPLSRALSGLDAWVCGLRRDQAATRAATEAVDWDEAHDLLKINPLHCWKADDVWAYVRAHGVPYNPLHDHGFPSIGCACCTRAVQCGDDPRSGRWWWEEQSAKECGLHWVDGRLRRK